MQADQRDDAPTARSRFQTLLRETVLIVADDHLRAVPCRRRGRRVCERKCTALAALPGRLLGRLSRGGFELWCESAITSFTPRSPRRVSERRNALQNVSPPTAPTANAEHFSPCFRSVRQRLSRPPTISAQPPHLSCTSRSNCQRYADAPSIGRLERLHALVDIGAQPRCTWLLLMPSHPHGLDELVHRARRDTLRCTLPGSGGERLLAVRRG